MPKSKRGPVLWFFAGAAFMLTLGPILTGAIGALFWTHPSDGPRGDTSAAQSLLSQSDARRADIPIPNLKYIILTRMPFMNCSNPAKQIADSQLPVRGDAFWNIQNDIDGAWADRIVSAADYGPYLYLLGLPHPLLGGLDACVSHSLLAPICGAITRSMMRHNLAKMVHEFANKKAQADSRATAESCALIGLAVQKEAAPENPQP